MNMQLIREITELDLELSHKKKTDRNGSRYWFRRAARSVVFNANNEIALLYVTKHNYYKLPGGGIEANEQVFDTLKREVLEEVGVDIEIGNEIGLIIEYRDEHELIQFSYCFLSRTKGTHHETSLTEEEIANGLSLQWLTLEDAISKMEQNKTDDYAGRFIRERDYSILKEVRDNKSN